MHDAKTKETSGYALIRDRESLEKQRPELASRYQSFLREFAQFREVQSQFKQSPKKGTPSQSTFAARLK